MLEVIRQTMAPATSPVDPRSRDHERGSSAGLFRAEGGIEVDPDDVSRFRGGSRHERLQRRDRGFTPQSRAQLRDRGDSSRTEKIESGLSGFGSNALRAKGLRDAVESGMSGFPWPGAGEGVTDFSEQRSRGHLASYGTAPERGGSPPPGRFRLGAKQSPEAASAGFTVSAPQLEQKWNKVKAPLTRFGSRPSHTCANRPAAFRHLQAARPPWRPGGGGAANPARGGWSAGAWSGAWSGARSGVRRRGRARRVGGRSRARPPRTAGAGEGAAAPRRSA